MHQKKSKKIIIYFFLLILVGSISNNSINNLKFEEIKNINILGLEENNQKILLQNLNNLNLKNIFYLNKKNFQTTIEKNSLIEEYTVTKKYPNSIDIKIKKTNFIAKIKDGEKFFLVGSNGKLTDYNHTEVELPYIFGNPKINEILELKKIIEKSKIQYTQIKSLYYFKSKRWDLKFKNNILIKLPEKVEKETLDYLFVFLKNIDLESEKIIDARISNKIIISNE